MTLTFRKIFGVQCRQRGGISGAQLEALAHPYRRNKGTHGKSPLERWHAPFTFHSDPSVAFNDVIHVHVEFYDPMRLSVEIVQLSRALNGILYLARREQNWTSTDLNPNPPPTLPSLLSLTMFGASAVGARGLALHSTRKKTEPPCSLAALRTIRSGLVMVLSNAWEGGGTKQERGVRHSELGSMSDSRYQIL